MKKYYLLMSGVIVIAAAVMVIQGCKYDAKNPLWDEPFNAGTTPVITSVVPESVATPGVNTITINGQYFAPAQDSTDVYFGTYQAEIVSNSSTSITVRRPNLVIDACELRVSPRKNHSQLESIYNKPYKIDPVLLEYGNFVNNVEFNFVAVDKQENVYACFGGSDTTLKLMKKIVKVTPSGEQSLLPMQVTRTVFDAKFGPDDRLYLFENNRIIEVVDFVQNTVTQWTQLPAGKIVKYGDFDANGYLYTGFLRSDLVIVAPDLSTTSLGVYTGASQIDAVRVCNGYVYLAVKAPPGQSPAYAIWRHAITGNGVLGEKDLVIDWSASPYSSRTIKGLTFSSDGIMYIATDSPNPLLIADPNLDVLYKSILNPYCKGFYWGTGNYIYMICGNATPAEKWKIYRVDVGTTGAPYGG